MEKNRHFYRSRFTKQYSKLDFSTKILTQHIGEAPFEHQALIVIFYTTTCSLTFSFRVIICSFY